MVSLPSASVQVIVDRASGDVWRF